MHQILLARAPAIVIEFAHHRRARVSRRDVLRACVPVLVIVFDAERPGVRVLPRTGVILYKHGHARSKVRGQQKQKEKRSHHAVKALVRRQNGRGKKGERPGHGM